MSRIVIDKLNRRINLADLEIDGERVTIKAENLPDDAVAGDVLKFKIDHEQTNLIREQIRDTEDKLFK